MENVNYALDRITLNYNWMRVGQHDCSGQTNYANLRIIMTYWSQLDSNWFADHWSRFVLVMSLNFYRKIIRIAQIYKILIIDFQDSN